MTTAELDDLLKKQMQFINSNKELLVQAWIAKTGLSPDESVLVEKRCEDGTIRYWVEKKNDNF